MKLKPAITESVSPAVIASLSSAAFATAFFDEVVHQALGVENPLGRPAEFYIQRPDLTIDTGAKGVETRITGISRGNRTPEQFVQAAEALHGLVTKTVARALFEAESDEEIQIFSVLMLDGDVPALDGKGYTSIIEHHAVWVNAHGIIPNKR